MSSFKMIWKCMFSPRLKGILQRSGTSQIEPYNPTALEKYGDNVVYTINMMCNFGLYASPLLLLYLYRRNYFMADGLVMLLKFSTSLGAIFALSLYVRSWGRANQPVYLKFLSTLETCQQNMTAANKKELQKYDFDFYAWPVEYRVESNGRNVSNRSPHRTDSNLGGRGIFMLPFQVISYVAIHSFGVRLIYPGSIGIIQALLDSNLVQGRARLIQAFGGERFKLRTSDENDIDAMFIDNRQKSMLGNVLFVCSEGNAGFYEIGIMCTPIDAGYSVLGWNHPGFGGSTGRPYPDQEQNAIDAVMQFAINKLGFQPEQIVLYGWSIGGYTSSWAACSYPNSRAVILDASFDDILPLAIEHMPKAISPIVKIAIRDYVNLNNIQFLKKYPGPVLLIRRSEDEVICTEEQNISTNRGNFLLSKLLIYRYPLIYKEEDQLAALNEFLALTGQAQDIYYSKLGVNEDICTALLKSYIDENSKSYPMLIGQTMTADMKNKLAVFLARRYFKDYKSTHCTPLPVEFLSQLWDISA